METIEGRPFMGAPRVTKEQVNELLERVEYVTNVPTSTTSTFTHSYLVSKDGKRRYHLATGHSACVSPENFDAQVGIDISSSRCEQATKDALWSGLGFSLFLLLDN